MPGLQIFELPVGPGRLALSPLMGGGAPYAQDLAVVRAWQPALVLSMTTLPEMQATGAGGLADDLAAMGAAWRHLPIRDFDAPGPAIRALWPEVSQEALLLLQGGARVLIHCRGGCGRSGMVMLRLMIESGEPPDAALQRLRDLRPCAVETDAQMAWAYQAAPDQSVSI